MQKTLSKQGARDTKLTVLIPKTVMDDLKALRMATFQSTGDLVNQLIEEKLESNLEAVKEGRRLLIEEQERQSRAMARRNAASVEEAHAPAPTMPVEAVEDDAPVPASETVQEHQETSDDAADPEPMPDAQEGAPASETVQDGSRRMPTEEDVTVWSQLVKTIDDRKRRMNDGKELVVWVRSEGRPCTVDDVKAFEPVIRERYAGRSEETVRRHLSNMRSFAKWWSKQIGD